MDVDLIRLVGGGGAVLAVVVLFLRHIGTTQAAIKDLLESQRLALQALATAYVEGQQAHQAQYVALVREVQVALVDLERARRSFEASTREETSDGAH